MHDPKLFGPFFSAPSWQAWRAFLAALFGLPMSDSLRTIYTQHTGRQAPPEAPAREGWAICGRRAGKSRIAALVAVYLACFKDYTAILAPGEVGTLQVLAADRKQARTILRYIRGLLDVVPILKQGILSQTAESISLSRRVIIEVVTASFRSTRGYTVIACVADELAFWRSEESANPDTEILAAIRPAMATTKGVLLCISSPYARKGALWQAYRDHFAKDGSDVLVWQAPSRAMNPEIDEATVARALADDPAAARAEWGGEFRADIETFVSIETLTALVSPGVTERGPIPGASYYGFVDPAGGSGADSMTLGIAHADRDTGHVILDLVAEVRPPFSPESVATDFAAILTRYAIRAVTGDKYGGDFPAEAFKRHGIRYRAEWEIRDPASYDLTWTVLPKSDIYREVVSLFNNRTVALLEHPRLLRQLASLERRTGPSGRDQINHPPNQHDDVANAAAGALLLAARQRGRVAPFARALTIPAKHILGTPDTLAGVGAVARSVPRPSAGAVGGQARYLSRWYG